MADSVFITNTELSVNESAGQAFESISRTGSLVGDVTVTYGITGDTAVDGQDFTGGTGTVTIPSGVSQVTVPIPIIDDLTPEPTETFVFSIVDATGAQIFAPRTSRVSILDNETPAPPPTAEPPLTSNFNVTQVPLVSGLGQPIRFLFSPLNASQVYVAEKSGVIALADLSTGTASTVIDLSSQVNNIADRGLMDIALDPNFAQNGFIYAFMVVDPPDTAGKTGGEIGPAGPDGFGNRYSQVVRYTADPATGFSTIIPNSAKILLGGAGKSLADISGGGAQDFTDPKNANAPSSDQVINPGNPTTVINGFKQDYIKDDSLSHAGGHLNFGPDGALYVSIGDGTSFDFADPRTPNVQSLDSLSGKILRIDPATGLGLPDNPFVTSGVSLDSNQAKVFQLGLRNPFSVTFAPDGRLFIADTGWNSWEEIDSGGPGANFGWPFFEGGDGGVNLKTPTYNAFPAATTFYNAVAAGTINVTAPFRAFSHNSADPGFKDQVITAGEAIYTGTVYPSSLQNNFIFTDFTGQNIFAINVNNSSDVKLLYSTNAGVSPIDFVEGSDGFIYYSQFVNGEIGRLLISDSTAPVSAPITQAVGSGPDSLVLKISQDAFQGSAQYTVSVDGVQIGGTLTAGASHAAGQDDTITVLGTFGAGNHTLTVNFLNDLFNGTVDTDRNLYVDSITFDTTPVPNGTAALLSAGPMDFAFTSADTPPVGGTPPPVGGTPPPVGGTPPPVGGTPPPVGGTPPPVGGTPPPVGGTPPPVGGTPPPVGGTPPPVGGTPPPVGGTPTPTPTPGLAVLDTSTGQLLPATADPYDGPVARLQEQYINITADNLNITVSTPNWFIHSGSGDDAIAVTRGTNVLDGGTGSNFLAGGRGTDTFFVDDRGLTSDIWSTVVGFHANDSATIWGVTPQDFGFEFADDQGADGFTGLTLHATADGLPTASLTLADFTQADINSGRLSVTFGTDDASGSDFMFIHANS